VELGKERSRFDKPDINDASTYSNRRLKKMYSIIARRHLGLFIAIGGLATLPLPSFGQSNTVRLCGVELHLGMPKDDVISKVGKDCKLHSYSPNWWFVIGGHDLVFHDDALSSVSKDLGTGGDSSGILAEFLAAINQAVGGTVSILNPEGPGKIQDTSHTAVVTVNTSLTPGDGNGGPGIVIQGTEYQSGPEDFHAPGQPTSRSR
jgi:hypothetical protein